MLNRSSEYYFEEGRSKLAAKYFKKTLDETDPLTQYHALAKICLARATEGTGDAMAAIDLYFDFLDYVDDVNSSGNTVLTAGGNAVKLDNEEAMSLLATALYAVAGDDYLGFLDGFFEERGPKPYQVDLYLSFIKPFKRDVRNDLILQMYGIVQERFPLYKGKFWPPFH